MKKACSGRCGFRRARVRIRCTVDLLKPRSFANFRQNWTSALSLLQDCLMATILFVLTLTNDGGNSWLQEFHEKGKLTDQEFVAAKTATLKKHSGKPTASVRPGFTWSRAGAAVLGVGIHCDRTLAPKPRTKLSRP
jgi:hypothetical protein